MVGFHIFTVHWSISFPNDRINLKPELKVNAQFEQTYCKSYKRKIGKISRRFSFPFPHVSRDHHMAIHPSQAPTPTTIVVSPEFWCMPFHFFFMVNCLFGPFIFTVVNLKKGPTIPIVLHTAWASALSAIVIVCPHKIKIQLC